MICRIFNGNVASSYIKLLIYTRYIPVVRFKLCLTLDC